jgi:hypothetical protein
MTGLGADPLWVNPANGVAVLGSAQMLLAYPPGGGSVVLDALSDQAVVNAGVTDVAWDLPYIQTFGNYYFSLQPGNAAVHIGNGKTLGLSGKQILFRDLDGICSLSL